MTASGRWLTAGEVAERAGVGLPAVSNWRKRHADTFPQPNAQGVFDSVQIDRWLTEQGKISEARTSQGKLRIIARRNTALSLAYVALVSAAGSTAAADPLASAEAYESRRRSDEWRGVLSVPLERLRELPSGEWTSLSAYLTDLLDQSPPAEVFERLIEQSNDRDLRRADPSAALIELTMALAPRDWQAFLTPTPGTGRTRMAFAGVTGRTGRNVAVELHEDLRRICMQRTLVSPDVEPRGPVLSGDFFDPIFRGVGGFDLVVATPDYGTAPIPDSAAARWLLSRGIPDRQSTDSAWLLRCREALSDHGRALVVTSERGGYQLGAAQQVRHELLRAGSVEAIISLEPGLMPGRLGQSLLWVLRPPNPAPASVLLVNAGSSPDGPHDLAAVARTYADWRDHHRLEPVSGYAVAVPVLDLLADQVDVTPSRWTDVPADPDTALGEAMGALGELASALRQLVECQIPPLQLGPGPEAQLCSLHELAIQQLLTVQRPRAINRHAIQSEGLYPYVNGITEAATLKTAGYLSELPDDAVVTQPGDVLLATTGTVRACVDREGGSVLGSAVWCVRPQPEDARLAPDLLALLLSSPRIAAQAVGGTVRRLRHPKDVTIPLIGEDRAPAAASWASAVAELRARVTEVTTTAESASAFVATALDAGVVPARRRDGEW